MAEDPHLPGNAESVFSSGMPRWEYSCLSSEDSYFQGKEPAIKVPNTFKKGRYISPGIFRS